MNYSAAFLVAFNHAMLYEVGPWWDPTDPDVISGACETHDQRKKVGYVNISGDSGGLTKYGISKNNNPSIDVQNLNLDEAMEIYFSNYWLASKCNRIVESIATFYFDVCVNNGLGRAAKFIQVAVGATPDGQVGPVTLGLISCAREDATIKSMASQRANFYNNIVKNNSSQSKFLNGWLIRNSEVEKFSLSLISER